MAAEEGISLFSRPPSKSRKSQAVADDVAELATAQGVATSPAPAELEPRAGGGSEEGPSTFRSLGLSEWMAGVCAGLGMREPTPVQRACIPPILAGRDVIAVSQTGTGKTAAYALPLLQLLSRDPFGVFALILTPTRELALQIGDHVRALGSGGALREAVIIGGVDTQAQSRALAARPHVVVATPGRLAGLLELDPGLARCFARLRCLVLDEADRMLEPGFEAELAPVLAACPPRRQTLLLSATMTQSLVALQTGLLPGAFHYEAYRGLQTAARLREEFLLLPARVKEVYLAYVLRGLAGWGLRSAVVFVSTRRNCSLLHHLLSALEVKTAALHSGRSQRDRTAALDAFRAGVAPILLATDVAARGLDIPEVDLVVNYDLPRLARDYVHRVGRTARAGRGGWALSFVTQYEVQMFKGIEELLGRELPAWEPDEADVLKDITKVYAAKRLAALRCAEEEDAERASAGGRKRKPDPAAAPAAATKAHAGARGAAGSGKAAGKAEGAVAKTSKKPAKLM